MDFFFWRKPRITPGVAKVTRDTLFEAIDALHNAAFLLESPHLAETERAAAERCHEAARLCRRLVSQIAMVERDD